MEFRLLPVYVLLCLESISCNTGNEQAVPPVQPDDLNARRFKVEVVPTKEDCVKLFNETFEFETCKSPREKLDDDLRCLLIDEIGDSICSSDPRFDPKSRTRNVSALCDQEFPRNKSGNPTIVTMFLELWDSANSTANCRSICSLNGGQYHSICYFIFDYYKVLSSKVKPKVPTKSKPSANNDESAAKSEAANASHDAQNVKNKPINDAVGGESLPVGDADAESKQNVNPGSANANDDLPGSDQKENVVQSGTSREEHVSRSDKEQEEVPQKKAPSIQSKRTETEEDSHASFYFMLISGVCIVFYFMMYNKKKILALVIEGRKRNVKRRPNSAAYCKLDCNLEEAMASGPSTSTSNTLLY